ncbi:methionyl-tRNA formyltransferase [Chondromyces apiculatus]|uniref:Methionyl-tRNA formyltransferase n=1 Tax=Chondromyces apiculatus DSM 436 TaxID=1192034 RepID=A0A017T4D6_9BACT|nr:methionyl-tRNA formyltransferase [Chondromyces apiculatus]EYF03441.1 Methionyl-tRNA formyltransferase [Chondromyces apiculatus DSM 436]
MRAVFFGTPEIAVPSLEALVQIADVVGVVCQPDRPAGRGLERKPPPVKRRAEELGLTVLQPEKVRTPDFAAWLRERDADIGLVIAYGRILPRGVLEAPRRGCLNLHASILPHYRGAAPITWAVTHGVPETGISLMQMDEGMDTGPVYTVHRIPLGPDETADELAVRLAQLAAEVVREDVPRAMRGEITATPQDHAQATAARILTKEDGRIIWQRPAREVHNHVRGMTSWPGAFTTVDGKLLKILSTQVAHETGSEAAPGTVTAADRFSLRVACASGEIAIVRAQMEGRKALGATELVAGRSLREGQVLGS